MKTRVAVVTTHLPDYKVHLYAGMAKRPGIDLMMWHGPAQPGLDLPDVDPRGAFSHRSARSLHFKLGLPVVWQRVHRELWQFQPHVIVLDEFVKVLSHWPIFFEARRRGVPIILYGHGENLDRFTTRSKVVGEVVEQVRLLMHRLASAVVLYTERSARGYRARHPHTPAFVALNTVDTQAIADTLATLPADHRRNFRAQLGVPDGALLAASVGRMIPQHDPRRIFEAVLQARREGAQCHMLTIGSGPLEAACHDFVASLPESERTAFHLLPRQPMPETSRMLAGCDLFIQPGTTGLAITHAFACGLGALVHAHENHAPEVHNLEHGYNGLLLPDFGPSLVATLVRLEREPIMRQTIADNAARYAREKLSPEVQVQGFMDAIDFALGRGATRPATASEAAASHGAEVPGERGPVRLQA